MIAEIADAQLVTSKLTEEGSLTIALVGLAGFDRFLQIPNIGHENLSDLQENGHVRKVGVILKLVGGA